MIKRYSNAEIAAIFSDAHKLELWQETELAVMRAMTHLNFMSLEHTSTIWGILTHNPIDLEWWRRRDQEIHHDLNAFLDERLRFIPQELHQYFHKDITSYDTEEPALARMLLEALEITAFLASDMEATLAEMANKYRYTIMLARTHGQGAELQSFGARVLSWLAEYRTAKAAIPIAMDNLKYSKLSGAIGKYGSLDPAIEERALGLLGFKPFYGATQIMPRVLYAPLAQAMSNLVAVVDKIANDIRLAARSGRPLMQEPFGKKQKGSSAMPHKKNTIRTEQIEGLARMAKGYAAMISDNIKTWEERAIEQSSVERVAWPDLFHVTARALQVMTDVLRGLQVNADNMLWEIHEMRGTYASAAAKEFLKQKLSAKGFTHEDVYRLVQLACFNVFAPDAELLAIRERIPQSYAEARENLWVSQKPGQHLPRAIDEFIPLGQLHVSDNLEISQETVDKYNKHLRELFLDEETHKEWRDIFTPQFLLRYEDLLYKNILPD